MASAWGVSSTKPVIVDPTAKHTGTLIFLHGLGDTGHGWAGELASLSLPHIKIICPTAPIMPVSLNAGFKMPSWFDLKSLDPNDPEDEDGIKKASLMVHAMIEDEIKNGIPSHRILLGGFSQGGALALYSALQMSKGLAGVLAIACWLPMHRKFPEIAVGNLNIPYLHCHGELDPVVPLRFGQLSALVLKKAIPTYQFTSYPGMMHGSCDKVKSDSRTFLETVLPAI